MISTSFSLPFPVWYSERIFSSGFPVQICIRVTDPEKIVLVESVMKIFSTLAQSGALSGRQLVPWRAEFSIHRILSNVTNELIFQIDRCQIADEALIVLAHMLLAKYQAAPIDFLEIVSAEIPNRIKLLTVTKTLSTYPEVFANLPFALDNLQPESGGFTFFIELQSTIELINEKKLNSLLKVWVDAILLGGFALDLLDPSKCYVEPDSREVTAYGKTIEWAIYKLRADSEATINALLNLLCAFHVNCQAIRFVQIS